MRSWVTGCFGTLVALLLAGCVMSPIPEPPQATFIVDKVITENTQGMRSLGIITGDPGAASPVGATIRVFNLDAQYSPVDGQVEANGSFMLDLEVDEGDELRFQIITDEYRFDAIDLVAGPPNTVPVLAERPLADCLLLEPAAEIDLAATQTVVVENTCENDVQLEAPSLRAPLTGIEIGSDRSWPEVVTPGGSITVDVQVDPDWDIEDIFFITVITPELDRRPITFVPP